MNTKLQEESQLLSISKDTSVKNVKQNGILNYIPGSMGYKFSKAIYNGKTKQYDIETDKNGISYIEDGDGKIVLSQDYEKSKKEIKCQYCNQFWKRFHQCEHYKNSIGKNHDNDTTKD